VLGTWNYPLLLAGVQVAQALAAGNAVLWKPAPGAEAATQCLAACFWDAGISSDLLEVAASDVASGQALIDAPVDHIVLTGSAATGRAVLQQAANWLTPATLELSGCDAVIVLPSADLDRLLDCLRFGLQTNSGATCIGPRRLIVTEAIADEVVRRLLDRFRDAGPQTVHPAARGDLLDAIKTAIDAGAVDLLGNWDAAELSLHGQTRPLVLDQVRPDFEIAGRDLFAPVLSLIRVSDPQGAITAANHCPYGLAASIFGDAKEANAWASQLSVGMVTINDLIAPTADPRLPFGGTRESGFGVTRGPEGLLAMTRPRVISTRNAWFAPHLRPRTPQDQALLTAALQLKHLRGGKPRWHAFRRLLAAGWQRDAASANRSDEKSKRGQRPT
jgi:aldehyde dehydrogenase (NAD+)